jgi:hypothetical protein
MTHKQAEMTQAKLGDRVSYEDRANPKRAGMVADIMVSQWGTQFVIAWQDAEGGLSVSDLRQYGWKLVAPDESL